MNGICWNIDGICWNIYIYIYVQYLIGPLISHTPRIRKLQNASRQYVFFPVFWIYPEMHEGFSRVTNISMEYVGLLKEYAGISMESVGIWMEYVGISMDCVGILIECVGICMESVGISMEYVGI
jgi:hypothetical protein